MTPINVFKSVPLESMPKIRQECAWIIVHPDLLLTTMFESAYWYAQQLLTFMEMTMVTSVFRYVPLPQITMLITLRVYVFQSVPFLNRLSQIVSLEGVFLLVQFLTSHTLTTKQEVAKVSAITMTLISRSPIIQLWDVWENALQPQTTQMVQTTMRTNQLGHVYLSARMGQPQGHILIISLVCASLFAHGQPTFIIRIIRLVNVFLYVQAVTLLIIIPNPVMLFAPVRLQLITLDGKETKLARFYALSIGLLRIPREDASNTVLKINSQTWLRGDAFLDVTGKSQNMQTIVQTDAWEFAHSSPTYLPRR